MLSLHRYFLNIWSLRQEVLSAKYRPSQIARLGDECSFHAYRRGSH